MAAAVAVFFLAGCVRGGNEHKAHGRPSATTFPHGTFVTTITHEDLARAGLSDLPDGTGAATLTLRNGTFRIVISQHPKQVDASGRVIVHGNQVAFDPPKGDVLKWSYFRGLLTFGIANVPDAAARLMWTAHPWREIK